MPNLAFRAASNAADSTFTVASLSATLPTGTLQNDLAVVYFLSLETAPTVAPTHTTPAGWSVAGTRTFVEGSGAFNVRVTVFYRIEPASPGAVTFTASSNSALAVQRLSFDNPDLVAPFDQISTGNGETWSDAAAPINAVVTGFTTPKANEMLVIFATGGVAMTWTAPADFTERVDANSTASFTFLFPTASATGNRTAVASTGGDGLIVMVAFRSEEQTNFLMMF